ncbi:MAG: type II secretion system protein [Candidatus Omnitrophica bacterium]|nr:type II secretion system protein [Candidatus Omnitrophota bacterium]
MFTTPLKSKESWSGFTLIELLIVIAIVLTLISIALPNFLEARMRAKVVRAEADLRSLATALESYRLDFKEYPPTPMESLGNRFFRLSFLTTPVSYMHSIPLEIFGKEEPEPYAYWSANLNDAMKYSPIYYFLFEEKDKEGRWALFSRGPDYDYEAAVEEGGGGLLMYYNPTNGSSSNGDLMRFGI